MRNAKCAANAGGSCVIRQRNLERSNSSSYSPDRRSQGQAALIQQFDKLNVSRQAGKKLEKKEEKEEKKQQKKAKEIATTVTMEEAS